MQGVPQEIMGSMVLRVHLDLQVLLVLLEMLAL